MEKSEKTITVGAFGGAFKMRYMSMFAAFRKM